MTRARMTATRHLMANGDPKPHLVPWSPNPNASLHDFRTFQDRSLVAALGLGPVSRFGLEPVPWEVRRKARGAGK